MNKKQFLVALLVLALSGLGGGLVSGWLFGGTAIATTVPERITAREFVLVDNNYKPRAILKMGEKGALLALMDSKQSIKASLQVYGPSGELSLAGQDGKIRLKLGERDANGTGLRLFDDNNKVQASLLTVDDLPTLIFKYPSGKDAVALGLINKKVSTLILNNDVNRAGVGLTSSGNIGGLTVVDERRKGRASLLYSTGAGGMLTMANPDGFHGFTVNVSPAVGSQLFMGNKKNDYSLRLWANARGSSVILNKSHGEKTAVSALGVSGQSPWLALRHAQGSKFETIFTKLGQPFLNVTDGTKKLWSVPANRPPATQELIIPFLQGQIK